MSGEKTERENHMKESIEARVLSLMHGAAAAGALEVAIKLFLSINATGYFVVLNLLILPMPLPLRAFRCFSQSSSHTEIGLLCDCSNLWA